MDATLEQAIAIISPYNDSLVPMSTIKECISLLSQSGPQYKPHIDLLRSQISIWGSDDTQMFSRQLTANVLIDELQAV